MAHYELPHVGLTAKSRISAGVGLVGVAHHMAKNHVSYTTPEGKDFVHRMAERHYYFLLEASLKLGKELGNAPWMDKTKWVDGYTPLDTYNKNVDEIAIPKLVYDWEDLSNRVKDNGGIRNSVLVAHMPAESSSKANGMPNGIYPIRDFTLVKTDWVDSVWHAICL